VARWPPAGGIALNETNLRPPIEHGEVRNPTGANQYTYRRQAERDLEKWCKKHGTRLVEKLLDLAAAGKPWAMKLALERILPVVQEHKVRFPEVDDAKLEAALDRFLLEDAREVHPKPNGNGAAAS
jgi:hypothetical protein